MSGLWTPNSGPEPAPQDPARPGPGGPGRGAPFSGGPGGPPQEAYLGGESAAPDQPVELDEESLAELREFQAQLAATPAIEVVANHAVGLYELAMLHLSIAAQAVELPVQERLRRVGEASIAADAFGGVVEALGDRFGPNAPTLAEALAQVRLGIVRVKAALEEGGKEGANAGTASDGPGSAGLGSSGPT
ncbi:MAG: hypothetical protein JWL73_1798 [Actinomycetia bacterium]|nr:hypothetical protein [Actinomycetes bacterium]